MKKFIVHFIGLALMSVGWFLLAFPMIAALSFDDTARLEVITKPTVEAISARVQIIDRELKVKSHSNKVSVKILALACYQDSTVNRLQRDYKYIISLSVRGKAGSISDGVSSFKRNTGINWWVLGFAPAIIFGLFFIVLAIFFMYWASKRFEVNKYIDTEDIIKGVLLPVVICLALVVLVLWVAFSIDVSRLPMMEFQSTFSSTINDSMRGTYGTEALLAFFLAALFFMLFAAITFLIEDSDFPYDLGMAIEKLIKRIRLLIRRSLLKLWLRGTDGKKLAEVFLQQSGWRQSIGYPALRTAINHGEEIIQISNDGIDFLDRRIEQKVSGDFDLPSLEITKTISKKLDPEAFIQLIATDTANDFLSKLRQITINKGQKHLAEKQVEELIKAYVQALQVKADTKFLELYDKNEKKLASEQQRRLRNVISSHVKRIMVDYQKSLAKVGEETIHGLLTSMVNDLSRKFYDSNDPLSNTKLPPVNTRFFWSDAEETVAVIEQPPQIRTIMVGKNLQGAAKGKEYYRLSFPYVVFVVHLTDNSFSNLLVYYRNKPLDSLNNKLYETNFPNVDGGDVCLGFGGHRSQKTSERINEVITHFWNSVFNTDRNTSYNSYQNQDLRLGFTNWEKETNKDPKFILSIDWTEADTLKSKVGKWIDTESRRDILKRKLDLVMDDWQEKLLIALSDFPIDESIRQKTMTAITKHEAAMITQLARLIEQTYTDTNHDPSLDQHFFEVMSQIMEQSLTNDFDEINQEIELKTSVTVTELIDKMKNINKEEKAHDVNTD